MAATTTYTHYSCPCSDISTAAISRKGLDDGVEDDDQTLNPYDPRFNYALYPLDHLLFCNECHEIRCPRCYYEEVVYYYCPTCLLETLSATVKGETNRCTRSCSQCPLCASPLVVKSSPNPAESRGQHDNPAMKDGPFVLSCPYCCWSTLDIGITLEKSININSQLKALLDYSTPTATTNLDSSPAQPESLSRLAQEPTSADDLFNPPSPTPQPESTDRFTALASFYKSQIADTQSSGPLGLNASYGFDSPSQLSRLLSTYGVGAVKKQRGRMPQMREALSQIEGLSSTPSVTSEADLIERLRSAGFDETPTLAQKKRQTHVPLLNDDLKPVPTPLRAKRAKRCRSCRHNLLRPDEKRQSTRYKIRLLALAYVPRLQAAPLNLSQAAASPIGTVSSAGVAGTPSPAPELPPLRPTQFKLTLHNPLFEALRVTLATPPHTLLPGAGANGRGRVTILCPQFEVGATTDAWNEALEGSARGKDVGAAEGQAPEAGKIWERGRNWTSVVLEVVPPTIEEGEERKLEIPVFVRVEYETEEAGGAADMQGDSMAAKGKDRKVKRELAYWCVLGVGTITSLNNVVSVSS